MKMIKEIPFPCPFAYIKSLFFNSVFYVISALSMVFLFGHSSLSAQVYLKPGFARELVTDQLDQPTCLTTAPDGRIFITEKGGKVKIIENGTLLPTPFLEVPVDDAGERGLGSITLDPDFETNGYVYVYYTVENEDHNRLSRFIANGNTAIPGSEFILIDFATIYSTLHNAGATRFGPDGKLYVSVGDGANTLISQDFGSLLGKFLRINPDGSIPTDNPYYNTLSGDLRAIYALGFRNSFTFDMHKTTGQILANDVGLVSWEEVNDVLPGRNYGWPTIEGFRTTQVPPPNYKDPLFVAENDYWVFCAVVGAAFYDPDTVNFPIEYVDRYIFSDYCNGVVRTMDPATGTVLDTLINGAKFLSNIWVSEQGYLYYLSFQEGEIWKVSYVGDAAPFISKQPKSTLVVVGETAEFKVEAGGDMPLQYDWYKDGTFAQSGSVLSLPGLTLADSGAAFYSTVTNSFGTLISDTVILHVTSNQRPVPNITTPLSSTTYSNGDTLFFSGDASDNEDGNLTASDLKWKIDFYHDLHFHPAMPLTNGIANGYFLIPRLGETDVNVFYRVNLTATDSKGLAQIVYQDVYPNFSTTNFLSTPGSFELELDGIPVQTPYSLNSVTGNSRVVKAPRFRVRNDSLFLFKQWATGDTSVSVSFHTGDQAIYSAAYEYIRPFFQGIGDGLEGNYYDNIDFDPPAVFTQIDPEVDFYWDWVSPLANSHVDSVSVRWGGSILAPITGIYTFGILYNGEGDLYINGIELIDGPPKWNGYYEGVFYFLAGQRYPIQVDFIKIDGSSRMNLFWSYEDQAKEIIPQAFLYSDKVPVNIANFNDGSNLKIYPNPTGGELNFILKEPPFPSEISIVDLTGKIVKQIQWSRRRGVYQMDISDLPSGVYLAKVNIADEFNYWKILKK